MSPTIIIGDALAEMRKLPAGSVNMGMTSPPYFGLRDYDCEGQMGLESTPDEYIAAMVIVFRELRRVLRDDGTLWLNIADSYAGSWGAQSRGHETPGGLQGSSPMSARQIEAAQRGKRQTGTIRATGVKPKDLYGIPWMLAFALRADGWYLRQEIIWHKPNAMPESTKDRCTKAHESLFLLSKSERYHFDNDAIAEPANYPEGAGNTKGYVIPGQRDGENANLGGGYSQDWRARDAEQALRLEHPDAPFQGSAFRNLSASAGRALHSRWLPRWRNRARSVRRRWHDGNGGAASWPQFHPDRAQSGDRCHG